MARRKQKYNENKEEVERILRILEDYIINSEGGYYAGGVSKPNEDIEKNFIIT